jgi:hypothetical protein
MFRLNYQIKINRPVEHQQNIIQLKVYELINLLHFLFVILFGVLRLLVLSFKTYKLIYFFIVGWIIAFLDGVIFLLLLLIFYLLSLVFYC